MISTLHLGLSYACNLKCRHCYVKKKKELYEIENRIIFTSKCLGKEIDEVGMGKIFLNGDLFYSFEVFELEEVAQDNVEQINLSLLNGESEFNGWKRYLLNSLAIVLAVLSNSTVEECLTKVYDIYESKALRKYIDIV